MMIETQRNVRNVLKDLNYTLKGEEVRATLPKEAYGKSASDVLQSFFSDKRRQENKILPS